MNWQFQPASSSFEEIRDDWSALNRAAGNHILLDPDFVVPLIRWFGKSGLLAGVRRGGENSGVALVVSRGKGCWETFQPSQAPLGLMLLDSADPTGAQLQQILKSLPGYALQFSVLQQDPSYTRLPAFSSAPHLEVLPYIETPRLELKGTFGEYWSSRSINLRHNLSRQRRRLQEKGHRLELLTHRSSASVDACLEQYGQLELKGWKAELRTAVTADNLQGRFYRDVFETFCARGEGVIYQLLLDGQVVASDLSLVRGGMMVVLKTAYDETANQFSWGLLMRQEILCQLFTERQIGVIEFYGRVMDWHRKWTDHTRAMYHLTCVRHPWVGWAKKLVKTVA